MKQDNEVQLTRLRNYQLMFRTSVACLALSLATTLFGVYQAVAESGPEWFLYGILMFIWSVGCAYLTVDSTVRIFDEATPGT